MEQNSARARASGPSIASLLQLAPLMDGLVSAAPVADSHETRAIATSSLLNASNSAAQSIRQVKLDTHLFVNAR